MTARRGEEEEDVLLQLFDLYWFKQHVLTNQPVIEDIIPKPQSLYHKTSSLHPIKSFTYQSLSSKEPISFNGAHSPSSVLAISPFDHDSSYMNAGLHGDEEQGDQVKKSKKVNEKIRKRRVIGRISGISKSLLELEIQEIKGFMDLGFTFSEEDKRSPRLVSILPGLQRLGSKEGQWKQDFEEASERVVSRSLLIMKKKKKNWRLPSSRNEIDMKNHLRMWAHAVASAVR